MSVGILAALAGCASSCSLLVSETGRVASLTATGLSFLAVMIAVISVWKRVNQLRDPVADSQAGSAQLSAGLLTIQEEERKRLSRELHDGVGQTITALKMELARIKLTDAGGDAGRLERARALADEALSTIRNVSLLLRPTALDDLGLEAALQWHVEDFSRRTSIRCHLQCRLHDDRSLPESVKTCIYRTIQEALNNCEKHSSADNAFVNVRQDSQAIRVSIADDGRGVQEHRSQAIGLGILGMRERATMLGGSLELKSDAGQGTRINLLVPIGISKIRDSPIGS